MMAGFGFFGLLLMLLFWGSLIVGAAWLVKAVFQSGPGFSGGNAGTPGVGAREVLDQRYARGEISREQYERMRSDLDA